MDINNSQVVEEITEAFWRYVEAISTNDIDTVISTFWHSKHVLRYGQGENLYGIDDIIRFRDKQRGSAIKLDVTRLVITAFGNDYGTANCEMYRSDTRKSARMSHTWARFDDGWRIVAAHLSPNPAS